MSEFLKAYFQGLSYNIEDEQQDAFLTRVLECAKSNIRTLDLSEWQNVRLFLYALTPIHLTTLVLYDVQFLETSIVIIKDIKTLVWVFVFQYYLSHLISDLEHLRQKSKFIHILIKYIFINGKINSVFNFFHLFALLIFLFICINNNG